MMAEKKKDESALAKICRDTSKLATEQMKGLSSQIIKNLLFNSRDGHTCGGAGHAHGGAPMEL
jgi:COP9 signalosome complex subunit 5